MRFEGQFKIHTHYKRWGTDSVVKDKTGAGVAWQVLVYVIHNAGANNGNIFRVAYLYIESISKNSAWDMEAGSCQWFVESIVF